MTQRVFWYLQNFMFYLDGCSLMTSAIKWGHDKGRTALIGLEVLSIRPKTSKIQSVNDRVCNLKTLAYI